MTAGGAACRHDGDGPSGATRKRCSAIRSTRVPSGSHAPASRSAIHLASSPDGEPGAAVVEVEADQLQLDLGIAGPPDRQHAQVVSQPGVDRVVVERVAEVVEQRAAPAPSGAVEDVRRVPGDEIGARLLQLPGRPALPARWLGGHVGAPVRKGHDVVALPVEPRQLVRQPVGNGHAPGHRRRSPASPGRPRTRAGGRRRPPAPADGPRPRRWRRGAPRPGRDPSRRRRSRPAPSSSSVSISASTS